MTSTFSDIAGDSALDLVNTVHWRLGGDDRVDALSSYEDVLAWCLQLGFVDPRERRELSDEARAHRRKAEAERAAVVALREATYQSLFEDDPAAALVVADAHREALQRSRLVADADGWRWDDVALALTTPRDRIARALVDLFRRDDLDRLHQCEDARCGWVYLDTSPRRNRRWCATKDCGDRNRSRAYYARKKGQASEA